MAVRLADTGALTVSDWTRYEFEFPAEARMRNVVNPPVEFTTSYLRYVQREARMISLPESMLAPTTFDATPDEGPLTHVSFVQLANDDDLPGW